MKIYENHAQDARYDEKDTCPTITSRYGTGGGTSHSSCIKPHVFKLRSGCNGGGKGYLGSDDKTFTLATNNDQYMMNEVRVRKLTPRETERLQGFPDDWTKIPYKGKDTENCPDSPRYKAIGNSWCVPCVRWIGKRIQAELDKNESETETNR